MTKQITLHTMPEDYYSRWEQLRQTERRLFRSGKWSAWLKASRRLVAHENFHNTL